MKVSHGHTPTKPVDTTSATTVGASGKALSVLMLTDVYFPRINGVSTSIETFRAEMPNHGMAIRLVAPAYPNAPDDPDVWRVPSRRIPFDPEDRLMRWRPLNKVVAMTASPGVDLVHIQTPFAAHYAGCRLARQLRVPVIATYHTHFEEYVQHYVPRMPEGALKKAARTLARHQCRALDAIIVPSPAMREMLVNYGVTTPIHIVPTGIPIGQFANGNGARFRLRHGIAGERPVALYVGRVAHEKNIGFLLQSMTHAIARCPNLLLVIAGEGPALAALRHRTAMLGLAEQVRFVGYLDRRQELPDCYAAANIFAFASRTETQGLVLLEAMAAGLPVYALSHLGTRSIIEPGVGAIAAPDHPEAFGLGLANLIGDSSRLATLADDARLFAREWSAPERARQLASLYRALVF